MIAVRTSPLIASTFFTVPVSARPRRALAALGAAMLMGLALAACESSGDHRVPSLFPSNPTTAGDTNTTIGGTDDGRDATGASNYDYRDTHRQGRTVR